jgi:hypothetical protein
MPLTTPVTGSTDAIAGVCVLHIPPNVGSRMVAVLPKHTLQPGVGHDMVAGSGFTVNEAVAKPPPAVYVIVTTPGDPPVTRPVLGLMVAIRILLLLHVPERGVHDRPVW